MSECCSSVFRAFFPAKYTHGKLRIEARFCQQIPVKCLTDFRLSVSCFTPVGLQLGSDWRPKSDVTAGRNKFGSSVSHIYCKFWSVTHT